MPSLAGLSEALSSRKLRGRRRKLTGARGSGVREQGRRLRAADGLCAEGERPELAGRRIVERARDAQGQSERRRQQAFREMLCDESSRCAAREEAADRGEQRPEKTHAVLGSP